MYLCHRQLKHGLIRTVLYILSFLLFWHLRFSVEVLKQNISSRWVAQKLTRRQSGEIDVFYA